MSAALERHEARAAKAVAGWFSKMHGEGKRATPERFAKAIQLTQGDYETLVQSVQAAAAMACRAQLAASEALERIGQLEGCGIRYQGVWQRAQSYGRGSVVTHAGSAWIVVAEKADSEPGTSVEWQLMVKAGRDAR